MVLLLFYLSLALVISFLCSIMEAVLLSTPQSFLIVKSENGNAWAKSFFELKTNEVVLKRNSKFIVIR